MRGKLITLRRCPACAGLHGPGECSDPHPHPCRACSRRHSPRLRCEAAARLLADDAPAAPAGPQTTCSPVVDLQVQQPPVTNCSVTAPATPAAPGRPKTNAQRQAAWRAKHREKALQLDRERKRARKGPPT